MRKYIHHKCPMCSSELGKFPLKGYWKWELFLYTIIYNLFVVALCFMILLVYLAYFDDGSESVEVDVMEMTVTEVPFAEVDVMEVDEVKLEEVDVYDWVGSARACFDC